MVCRPTPGYIERCSVYSAESSECLISCSGPCADNNFGYSLIFCIQCRKFEGTFTEFCKQCRNEWTSSCIFWSVCRIRWILNTLFCIQCKKFERSFTRFCIQCKNKWMSNCVFCTKCRIRSSAFFFLHCVQNFVNVRFNFLLWMQKSCECSLAWVWTRWILERRGYRIN